MVNVKMEEEDVLELLVDRVRYWTDDDVVINLFQKMYNHCLEEGYFEDTILDIQDIVDNDYVNFCFVVLADIGDPQWNELYDFYIEHQIGDCSVDIEWCSYIEAVDEENNFLVRR